MKEGFYKLDGESLLYAPTFVCAPGYELRAEMKDNYTYPVDGWKWFNSVSEACVFFNIDEPKTTEQNG